MKILRIDARGMGMVQKRLRARGSGALSLLYRNREVKQQQPAAALARTHARWLAAAAAGFSQSARGYWPTSGRRQQHSREAGGRGQWNVSKEKVLHVIMQAGWGEAHSHTHRFMDFLVGLHCMATQWNKKWFYILPASAHLVLYLCHHTQKESNTMWKSYIERWDEMWWQYCAFVSAPLPQFSHWNI